MPWCCCSIHPCSVLVVKHLAQPDGLFGIGGGEMNLVHAAVWEKNSEVPPAPAWDQRGQDKGNSALETKLCMWNIRGTGTTNT